MRNLILTGGIRHDFEDNSDAVKGLLTAVGISSEVTLDIDAGIAALAGDTFDLVTVMALRWPMTGNPKYEPYRDAWGYEIPEVSRQGLRAFVENGGGLFALHTACLCFDDWDGWRDLLGGAWQWGQSHHPPRGPVVAEPTTKAHALTNGLAGFALEDEVFSELSLAEDTAPLMTARADGQESDQPVLWARSCGAGRVVFDAFGHDRSSIEHPVHGRIVQRCALWAGGAADAVVQRT